jgi:uncharacterized membrane protein YkoI
LNRATKAAGSAAALAALALGGSAIASGASNTTSSTQSSGASTQAYGAPSGTPSAPPGLGPHGRHVGANGKEEQALSTDVAKQVAAAALAKVKGTIERTETDVDHGSPYEAHIRKSDGTEVEVLVNESFQVTAVNTMGSPGPGRPGGPPPTQGGTQSGD